KGSRKEQRVTSHFGPPQITHKPRFAPNRQKTRSAQNPKILAPKFFLARFPEESQPSPAGGARNGHQTRSALSNRGGTIMSVHQHSAFSIQHSALRTQDSGLSTPH